MQMDKKFKKKINIRLWLLYSVRGQMFSIIQPSAECKTALLVIHWHIPQKAHSKEKPLYFLSGP